PGRRRCRRRWICRQPRLDAVSDDSAIRDEGRRPPGGHAQVRRGASATDPVRRPLCLDVAARLSLTDRGRRAALGQRCGRPSLPPPTTRPTMRMLTRLVAAAAVAVIGFTGFAIAAPWSSSWTTIAPIDINGDGRDELLFYNARTGKFSIRKVTSKGQVSGAAIRQ